MPIPSTRRFLWPPGFPGSSRGEQYRFRSTRGLITFTDSPIIIDDSDSITICSNDDEQTETNNSFPPIGLFSENIVDLRILELSELVRLLYRATRTEREDKRGKQSEREEKRTQRSGSSRKTIIERRRRTSLTKPNDFELFTSEQRRFVCFICYKSFIEVVERCDHAFCKECQQK